MSCEADLLCSSKATTASLAARSNSCAGSRGSEGGCQGGDHSLRVIQGAIRHNEEWHFLKKCVKNQRVPSYQRKRKKGASRVFIVHVRMLQSRLRQRSFIPPYPAWRISMPASLPPTSDIARHRGEVRDEIDWSTLDLHIRTYRATIGSGQPTRLFVIDFHASGGW